MKDIEKYLKHLPTCNIMQDWSEAEMALADTPESLKDESWQLAYNEMREKMKTCTCGLESSLKSMRDVKEEKLICPNCGSTSELYSTLNKGHCRNCGKLWTVSNINKLQSSPQPQPGRGAENEIEKLKKEHDDLLFMAGGLTQCHQSNMRHELLIKVHNLKEQIKHLEEYRTQSEGKDMYPKEFVEWIKLNCYSKRGGFSSGKIWGIIGDESNIFYGTPELFNHWSINHK